MSNKNLYSFTFEIGPRRFDIAQIVDELPTVGRPFHLGHIHAAEVFALEPFPYPVPQDLNRENYRYSVWRVVYRPDNLVCEAEAYVAVHEAAAEKI